jgi:hypothetical protein
MTRGPMLYGWKLGISVILCAGYTGPKRINMETFLWLLLQIPVVFCRNSLNILDMKHANTASPLCFKFRNLLNAKNIY